MVMQKKKKAPAPASAPVIVKNDDVPIIDWDEMSIMDSLAMMERADEQSYINVIAKKIEAGVATAEDWARLEELRSRDYQMTALNQQVEDMASFVSYVPRGWFKKSAGDNLDFDDPETYKLLQPKRFRELYSMLMMTEAQADNATGN